MPGVHLTTLLAAAASGTAGTTAPQQPGREPHLMRSCFSVARFCEQGVYWSKSHSAASEAGEEIKIWAVLASSQTSGCTRHCLRLRLRSSLARPPAPTCATERGEEGGRRRTSSVGRPGAAPGGRGFTAHQSFSLLDLVPHQRQTELQGALESPLWFFYCSKQPHAQEILPELYCSACPLMSQGRPFSEGPFIPGVTPNMICYGYWATSVQSHSSGMSLTEISLVR